MKKFLMLICAAMIFLTGCGNESPAAVTTEKVLTANDTLTLTYEGKIAASDSTEIMSPVFGNLMEKYVEDGSDVTEGQMLFKVCDFGPYADLLQIKVELAEDMTNLPKAMSDLQNAEKNFSAQEIADKKAAVENLQADITKHQEIIKQMESTMVKGIIYAPKSGRLEAVDAQLGLFVVENETVIATVGNINPVVVNFELSEAESKILAANDNLKISLKLSDGTIYPHEGTFKDGLIFFANPDENLALGSTAQIVIDGVKISNGLFVPENVIQNGETGTFVYVADNKKAAVRKIELGDKIGNYFVVKTGLKADDSIIKDGFENLREGVSLNVDDK
ncbi:MAG: hypothetical protein IKZ53_07515 [Selenomonadaceae bacterium]|nr:hypothetical protein [Selenomonadaceae bacterium]